MALEIKARVPATVKAGEPFEVKTLALAPPLADPAAEFDAAGLPVPHFVGFEALLEDRLAWRIDLGPGVSRNINLSFFLTADHPGTLRLRWHLRDGATEERTFPLKLA